MSHVFSSKNKGWTNKIMNLRAKKVRKMITTHTNEQIVIITLKISVVSLSVGVSLKTAWGK